MGERTKRLGFTSRNVNWSSLQGTIQVGWNDPWTLEVPIWTTVRHKIDERLDHYRRLKFDLKRNRFSDYFLQLVLFHFLSPSSSSFFQFLKESSKVISYEKSIQMKWLTFGKIKVHRVFCRKSGGVFTQGHLGNLLKLESGVRNGNI